MSADGLARRRLSAEDWSSGLPWASFEDSSSWAGLVCLSGSAVSVVVCGVPFPCLLFCNCKSPRSPMISRLLVLGPSFLIRGRDSMATSRRDFGRVPVARRDVGRVPVALMASSTRASSSFSCTSMESPTPESCLGCLGGGSWEVGVEVRFRLVGPGLAGAASRRGRSVAGVPVAGPRGRGS